MPCLREPGNHWNTRGNRSARFGARASFGLDLPLLCVALPWLLAKVGLPGVQLGASNWGIWLVFCYLWLPFVALPIYAALERVPANFLGASSDLGARGWTTFRRVIWPLAFPGVVAGSIFSFSLTLGDYITPSLIGKTSFIGNVVYTSVGVSGNVPFAAAYALGPVVIMAVYLLVARRLRAFEAL
jgi:putative spermidine/putrescine transport system permease protein